MHRMCWIYFFYLGGIIAFKMLVLCFQLTSSDQYINNDKIKVLSMCNFILHICMNNCHLSVCIYKKEFHNIH